MLKALNRSGIENYLNLMKSFLTWSSEDHPQDNVFISAAISAFLLGHFLKFLLKYNLLQEDSQDWHNPYLWASSM